MHLHRSDLSMPRTVLLKQINSAQHFHKEIKSSNQLCWHLNNTYRHFPPPSCWNRKYENVCREFTHEQSPCNLQSVWCMSYDTEALVCEHLGPALPGLKTKNKTHSIHFLMWFRERISPPLHHWGYFLDFVSFGTQ